MSHELTDTRITAYIFGELSPEETAAFERELANSTELQEELAAIRETLDALKSEFDSSQRGGWRFTASSDRRGNPIQVVYSQSKPQSLNRRDLPATIGCDGGHGGQPADCRWIGVPLPARQNWHAGFHERSGAVTGGRCRDQIGPCSRRTG